MLYNRIAFGRFAKGRKESDDKCDSITLISVTFTDNVSVHHKYLQFFKEK